VTSSVTCCWAGTLPALSPAGAFCRTKQKAPHTCLRGHQMRLPRPVLPGLGTRDAQR